MKNYIYPDLQVHAMRRSAACIMMVLAILILGGCGGGRAPEKIVERMYTALAEADQDAYLDTLLPANRDRPDLTGVLATVLGEVGFSAGGFGVNLGGMLSPNFVGMEYRTVSNEGGHAVVQARGRIRMMMMEYPFCETHDVVRSGGAWYVDNAHSARQARLERLMDRNRQRLNEAEMNVPETGDPLADIDAMFGALGAGAGVVLDMCE